MRLVTTSALLGFLATAAQAGDIENACLSSERNIAGHALCSCIQDVADRTLSARDQRIAAGFFKDPDRAQEVRQSDSRSKERFWERYVAFGEAAKRSCRG